MSFAAQAAILLAIFAAVTAVSMAAGAASPGVALGLGQIAFVLALAYLLLRR